MKSKNESEEYRGIFKSTFLFGFVQVFNILVKVITNKIVAVLLGAEGIGLIGIYNSTINLLKTGAGLGISQSAVRDISEANASGDRDKFSKIISVTKKVIVFTALLGCVITIVLSPWLSEWTLGNKSYVLAFVCLSIVVGINILTEGQLAILKGMRQLNALAKASMIGALAGFITAIPMYYFFGKQGIVPSLIMTALSALFFSNYFVKKIQYDRQKKSFIEVFYETKPMVQMGIGLMLSSFLISVSDLIISSFIRSVGNIQEVGYFIAGTVIMHGYFGVVINALSTDYYPRIAAINKNDKLLEEELNRQSSVSLILCCPLIVLFLFLLPLFVKILYTDDFFPTIELVKYGILGTIITICSNQVDMILVAKFKTKLFLIISIFYRIAQVAINIILYQYWGLVGSGIALTIMGVLHFIIMTSVVYKLYAIRYRKDFIKIAVVVVLFFILSLFFSNIPNLLFKYSIGTLLVIISLFYSHAISTNKFGIDAIKIVKDKFNK